MLPSLDKDIELEIENLASSLLRTGEAPIFYNGFEPNLKAEFERIAECLKDVDVVTKFGDLYPREIEITFKYLSETMTSLHLKSFVNRDFFFSKIDSLSSSLKNHVIRTGDHWGLVETNKLTTSLPKTWHLIDNTEVHIHHTIPGYTNSSLWLSEILSSVSQIEVFYSTRYISPKSSGNIFHEDGKGCDEWKALPKRMAENFKKSRSRRARAKSK